MYKRLAPADLEVGLPVVFWPMDQLEPDLNLHDDYFISKVDGKQFWVGWPDCKDFGARYPLEDSYYFGKKFKPQPFSDKEMEEIFV